MNIVAILSLKLDICFVHSQVSGAYVVIGNISAFTNLNMLFRCIVQFFSISISLMIAIRAKLIHRLTKLV